MSLSFFVHCRLPPIIALESGTSWGRWRREHRQISSWLAGPQELTNHLGSHLHLFLFNTEKDPKVRPSLLPLKDNNYTHRSGGILVICPNLTLSIALGFDHLLPAGKKLASEQWPLWQMARHRQKRASQKYSFPQREGAWVFKGRSQRNKAMKFTKCI